MKKEEKIIEGFIREINLHGIGDMYVSAEYDDMIYIEIESAHNVRENRKDFYNTFKDYCNQYFSSQEWLDFLEGESVDFSSRYHDLVEEMDYDYHEDFLSNNVFVIKHDIQREFQRYIDKHFDEIEEDYDEEDDSLPSLDMDADDYGFNVKVKITNVFPADWLLDRFNEDRKLKFSQEAQIYIEDYAEIINRSRNADRNIYISNVNCNNGFLNIFCAVYSDNKLSKDVEYFIKNLYHSNDFEKLVKGGIFGPKLDKVRNNWNDLIYVKVLDSDMFFNFTVDMKEGLMKHAETLHRDKTINTDIRNEIYNTEVRINLEYVDIIKEEELYYKVYEAREKAKKNKK